MAQFSWAEKYSVHVRKIDEQHRHFFEMVNEIIKMTGQDEDFLKDLISKISNLDEYATYHFRTEEEIFNKYNYPDTKEHVEAHDAYRNRIKQFMDEIRESPEVKKITLEVAEFAGSWLMII